MMRNKYVITGKIGSGKSAIADLIAKRGYIVLSADDICKEIMMRPAVIKSLNELGITDEVIRKSFFKDADIKKRVESLVHPLLYKKLSEIKSKEPIFFEIPLYFETVEVARKNGFIPDAVIYVDADDDVRHSRLIDKRNMSAECIGEREKYFISRDKAVKLSDYVIRNNGLLEDAERELSIIYEEA